MSKGDDHAGDPRWTIDELSAAAGVPTRTIREYRTVGVLPPPEKQGRVGIYGRHHLERLRLVGRLQARGYSLAGIRDLLGAWSEGRSLGTVLALGEPGLTLGDPGPAVLDEASMSMSESELGEEVPGLSGPDHLQRAEDAGLIRKTGDRGDRYAVRSPALLRLVAEAVAAGAVLDDVLEFVASFRAGARIQAQGLVQLVVEEMWDPGGDTAAMVSTARRVRVLIAQAAASSVVDELGIALTAAASTPEGHGLDELAAAIRVGAVVPRSQKHR